MAESTCVVSLPTLCDLALEGQEVGSVNFRVLHSLLQVIVHKTGLGSCNVEFRGDNGDKIQNLLATSKPGPSILLAEYSTEGGSPVIAGKEGTKDAADEPAISERERPVELTPEEKRRISKEEREAERMLRVIERRKDSKEDPLLEPPPMADTPMKRDKILGDTLVVVENTPAGMSVPQVSVAVPRSHWQALEEEVKDLKEQVRELAELPGNAGLIEAIRSTGAEKASPVLDMFQILNLTKRVDSCEIGINKLATMIEDLARGDIGYGFDYPTEDYRKASSKTQDTVVSDAKKVSVAGQPGETAGGGFALGGRHVDLSKIEARLTELEKAMGLTADEEGGAPGERKGLGLLTKEFSSTHIVEALRDLDIIREKYFAEQSPEERLGELEGRFNEYNEQIQSLDAMFNNQTTQLQTQLTDLEKEFCTLVERINTGMPAGDGGGVSDANVAELYNKILLLQGDMDSVADMANKLLDEKEERQKHMDAMLEQIETLKIIKANKEDLEDALADKADACAVNRKVSHDQFDEACDELTHGIEDALCKLTQQETLWQQALEDIQKEIGTKLDKMELTPLRDFVNRKLKMLQDRMKALANLKRDQEAAGTKTKLLRNVNCISCDKDVVMRTEMDPTLMPKPTALPPTRSMGPYLAYELDALRKQQKCIPGSRNMNHFENALSSGKAQAKDQDHICNRYCGGSHTTTTPQQRVARLGHFLNQWGPEIEPIVEGQVRGTDGQWYKTRETGPGALEGIPPDQVIQGNAPDRPIEVQGISAVSRVQSAPAQAESVRPSEGTLAPPSSAALDKKKLSHAEKPAPSDSAMKVGRESITSGPRKRSSTAPQEKKLSIASEGKERKPSTGSRRGSKTGSKRGSKDASATQVQPPAAIPEAPSEAASPVEEDALALASAPSVEGAPISVPSVDVAPVASADRAIVVVPSVDRAPAAVPSVERTPAPEPTEETLPAPVVEDVPPAEEISDAPPPEETPA